MKQNVRNDGKGANRVFSKFAAEKKKSIVALCLIAVMGFMWVRVLVKKGPESAEASVMTDQSGTGILPVHLQQTHGQDAHATVKISFIELPKVAGRNDVLTKDFFAANDWQDFIDGKKEVSVVSRDDDEEIVKRVTKKLKLEAIAWGKNPQAFINDKLLSVGDKLLVADGVDTYECEVVRIEEQMVLIRVLIRCREAEIPLRLTKT